MRNKIIAIGALIISSAFFLNDIPDAKLYFNISSGNSKFRDKKFDESRKVYEHILKDKDIDILKKNILRSFYEEKKYDELLKSKYKDGFLKGNSYVYTSAKSQDKKEILTKALEQYKEGMRESEDINIKKNYEIVLKMLNEEQNKDNKQDQKNNQQQDKQDQQQNKDNKDNQKDNKQNQKNNQQQDKQNQQQNKDNKDNQKDNKQDQKNNQQPDKQNQQQNKDNKENQKNNKQNQKNNQQQQNKQDQKNNQQQDKQNQQQNKDNKDNQKDNKQDQKNNQQQDKQNQQQQNNEHQQPNKDMNSDKSKEKSMSGVPQEMETQKLSKEDMKKAEIRAILKRLEGNEKQSFKNNERFIDISDDSNTNRW